MYIHEYIYKLYKILRLLMSLACLFFHLRSPRGSHAKRSTAMALPGSVPVQSALKAPADPAPSRGPKRGAIVVIIGILL